MGKLAIGSQEVPGKYHLGINDGITAEKVKVAIPGAENWRDQVFQMKISS